MKCPTCKTTMKIRDGKYGEFYFCPDQYRCGQKTISKNKPIDAHYMHVKHSGDIVAYGIVHYPKPMRKPAGMSYRSSTPSKRVPRTGDADYEWSDCACGQNLTTIGNPYCAACGHSRR